MKITRNSHFWISVISILAASVIGAQAALAQEEAPEPPLVNKIIVNFTGISNVNEEVVRANIALREGDRLDQILLDRDIRTLYRTRLFEFIEVRLKPLPENLIDVYFDIRPKFRISSISFEGNEKVRDRRLENEISIQVNQVLNEQRVNDDVATLKEFYLKRGFFKIRVEYDIDRNPGTGFGTVTFKISEGGKFRIAKVRFNGNETMKDRKLRRKMDTKKWGFFSFVTGMGKLDADKFEDDLQTLRDLYQKEGYLDVDIDPAGVQYSYPSKNRIVIDINVDEGKQYQVGEISFEGNELYKDVLLSLLLRVQPGSVYKPEKIDEDIETLEDFYGKFGYMETRVRLNRVPNVTTGDIDLVYEIYESEKFLVESIDLEGNTKTKSTVVVRELPMGPGSTFDGVRMEATRMRLENTRFFEDVSVTPQSTNIPNRKDMRIVVREGRTGNFSFGAGFDSVEEATFFIELTQSNFDFLNWRGAFQGDGQKFRLRANLGSVSSQIVLSFEEPWLFEKRLAVGFTISNTTNEFEFDGIEIEREGFEIYARKRLIEVIDGRLTYSFFDTKFSDTLGGPGAFQGSVGSTSSLNLFLLRDTRDRFINTFSGSRHELHLTYAGGSLGGDFNFNKIESRNAIYFPISAWHTQTVEVILRAGSVSQTEDSQFVPDNELFLLGGPNTLRGFEFGTVGPAIQNNDNFRRGKSYGMIGVEYSIGFAEGFRGAIFYDGGFVNKDAGDFNPSDFWADNFGAGVRISVMGTPLRIDYAVPITAENAVDEGSQFNFSFGGRF